MSRYITPEKVNQDAQKVNQYFAEKQTVLDNTVVPNFLLERINKGYYDGDVSGTSLDEMKSFWKIPEASGAALDAVIARAKIFSAGYSQGPLGVATTIAADPTSYTDLINFTDSDAQLDKNDPSGLYFYLTKAEQALQDSDETAQDVTSWGSSILSVLSGNPEAMMAAANQGIRETTQETLGMRHPELLENAVARYNADQALQAQLEEEKEANQQALDEVRDQFNQADLTSNLYVNRMAPILSDIQRRSTGQTANVPMTINVPSVNNIPVNMLSGRGLEKMNLNHFLKPTKQLYHERVFGGKDFVGRGEQKYTFRY